MFVSALDSPRFKSIGSIRHSVLRDCLKQVLVDQRSLSVAVTSDGRDDRPKCFERLQCAFETDGPRQEAVFSCSLSHDCPDEIVGECMNPDFFAHQFRGFAA